MEIMRCARVILQRRALPHSSSASIGGASPVNPPLQLARRGSSGVRPAPLACPTLPRTVRPPRPATPVTPRAVNVVHPRPSTPANPRAATTAHPRPTTSTRPVTPLESVNPSRPTYIPGHGLGQWFANIPPASLACRKAYQAVCRARTGNDRAARDIPSSSRRTARLSSDDSDSNNQPLSQRPRRRAPPSMPNLGPSVIPSPSSPVPPPTSQQHQSTETSAKKKAHSVFSPVFELLFSHPHRLPTRAGGINFSSLAFLTRWSGPCDGNSHFLHLPN
ncbi:ESX-1 secretion-associated protein EspI-like [Zingiber officinale]|uniref:ESX-1 secretion-associated protein EspI-like n=1 Tax=Zingiber officinale TaxID=94328 RepID=UPI001C4CD07B|nr:ESX-1 secretion-associated protein EspI-like [Zingiber officinale]